MAVRYLAVLLLCVVASPALAEQSAAPSVTTEIITSAAYSTQGSTGFSADLRVFGELTHGWRYFVQGLWSIRADGEPDAFSASMAGDNVIRPEETYVEKHFQSGKWIGGARLGRYHTPFGIHDYSDFAYTGFWRAPLLRYEPRYTVSNYWLEGGGDFYFGTPKLQVEGSIGTPTEVTQTRRDALDTTVRVQGYVGPFILGASHMRSGRVASSAYAHGMTEFNGVDARWMRRGLQIRGEWITGRPFQGVSTEGWYVDASLHQRWMGNATAVARYERLNYDAGPFSEYPRRFTAGGKYRITRSLTAQADLIFQDGVPHEPGTVFDIGLIYTRRY